MHIHLLYRRWSPLERLVRDMRHLQISVNLRSIPTRLVHWAFCFVLLTSSFDVALVVNVGGTVRLSQVALAFVCLWGAVLTYQRHKLVIPIGYISLLLWGSIQLVFTPFSVLVSKGAVYNVWLWFNIVALGCVV